MKLIACLSKPCVTSRDTTPIGSHLITL